MKMQKSVNISKEKLENKYVKEKKYHKVREGLCIACVI